MSADNLLLIKLPLLFLDGRYAFSLVLIFYIYMYLIWDLRYNFNLKTHVFPLFWKYTICYLKLQWFITIFSFFLLLAFILDIHCNLSTYSFVVQQVYGLGPTHHIMFLFSFRYSVVFILLLGLACLLEVYIYLYKIYVYIYIF